MKEYIEREALLQELAELYDNIDPRWQRGRDTRLGLTMAKKVIENQPTADVQEVVYCKDCKFWDNGRCEGIENGLIYEYTKPTDFCSYGAKNG